MNATLAAFIIAAVGWMGTVLWLTYRTGQREEHLNLKLRNHTTDIQELHRVISTNNDLQNERYADFYNEFTRLRLKLAAKLGINGED
jgi:hypothetical protein